MLRTLYAEILICEMFLLKKDVKITMRILQRNLQNVQLSIFQKINKERQNQSRNKNQTYVSRDENKKNFNCNDFLAHFNFKKHCDLNKRNMRRKINKSSKRYYFNEFAIFRQKRKNNMN